MPGLKVNRTSGDIMEQSKHLVPKNIFFDFGISQFARQSIVDQILESAASNSKTIFLGMNADCFNISRRSPRYLDILKDERNFVYPDGGSIVVSMKILKGIRQERIVTTDLVLYLLERIEETGSGLTISFLGSNNSIAEKARGFLNGRFGVNSILNTIEPGFISHEDIYPPFSPEVKRLIEELNKTPSDFLFVGLGCPKQEILCDNIKDLIPQKVLFPCGGLFSYYSGDHRRAPLWMQRNSLEWLFRLYLEPKRLWKRYLLGNIEFVYRVFVRKIRDVLDGSANTSDEVARR